MKTWGVRLLLGVFLCTLCLQQDVFALMSQIGLSELKERASFIVRGEVLGIKSEWNEEGTFIWTFVEVKVSQWMKGKGPEEEVITIKIPGGTVGNITQSSSDEIVFKIGEESVLFLGKETYSGREYFNVVGRWQGKFTISEGKIRGKVPVDKFIEKLMRN